jgi:phosphatidylserine/phosphatidylglycerophosphate/cardiolipin synthase-like enzyme
MRTTPSRLALVLACAALALTAALESCRPAASSQPGPAGSNGPAGRDFRLWQDAAIFDCARRLLARGGRGQRVWVEMYEFGRTDLQAALLAAHASGADVRLIVDRTVSVSAHTADRLAAAGLPVRAYPVDDSRHQIDHVKLLLVSGEALVGGMNWGAGSAANHDYALETAVPRVLDRLQAIFSQDWSLAGGAARPLASASGPVAETAPGEEVRAALLAAIGRARSSIDAEIYTLTDPDVLAGLTAAYRRGLRVRVLLDPGQDFNQPAQRLLARAGVGARWYPVPAGAKLHAKAGLFDGRQLLVGSANWTRSGLSVNHELDLLTEDPGATAAFSSRFERDWRVAS